MIHVFGAILVDAIACRDSFTRGSSSIAPIRVGVGGVGYNIFRALGRAPRRLVTATGDGPFSCHAKPVLDALSDEVLVRVLPGRDIGLYLAFMERGRLLCGATDASTFEAAMDVAWLDHALEAVGPKDVVVADGNLPAASLAHLLRRVRERGACLVFETVSVDKSERARDVLCDVFLATPTEQELEALLGVSGPSVERVTEWMRARRVEHLVVTLGGEGLRWVHGGKSEIFAPRRVLDVADTTGAGDTLLGALLVGVHGGGEMPACLRGAMDAVEGYLSERNGVLPG
jgi:sugar/nucleoside kinase (ribokinase family)